MPGSERFKNGFKNPIVFGTAAGILVILFNILIASLAGSAYIAGAILKDRAVIAKGI